jgi:Ca2+-binding RTX toxin-like protein
MRKGRPDLAATLAVAVASLVISSSALGATFRVVETTITEGDETFTVTSLLYEAAAEETNEATISRAGERIVVADPGATITADAGCTSIGANEAACPAAGVYFVRVLVRDLDDVVVATGLGQTRIYAGGGPGDDTIRSGAAGDRLSGGIGDDTIRSGAGDDFLSGGMGDDTLAGGEGDFDVLDGGRGADTLRGGRGFDVVDYGSRTNAVRVDFDGRADDGEPAERDTVGTDVEGASGGAADDVLVGNARHNLFFGGRGDDVITGVGGSSGPCWSTGRAAPVRRVWRSRDPRAWERSTSGCSDWAVGGGGNDRLIGGAGRDFMQGSRGDDVLVGGRGEDALSGDEGRDRLFARDGAADIVVGGPGRDRACIDRGLDDLGQVEILCPGGPGVAG